MSLELGVALPYMEDELEYLTEQTLLVKDGDKYETAFPIVSKQAQEKVWIVKASFSCSYVESWTINKAEHQRNDVFKLWCWRRLLKIPWTARRSNQSILKEINPECSLEGLMLKLQYFDHLTTKSQLIEKDPDAGKH